MVRQTAAGIYAWLPMGLRVLNNIAAIVREEQDAVGAQEMLMPTLQTADLWREAGRYDAYGPEMLRIRDRHERDLLYGPTNEEMITDIARGALRSYRELPQILYHIQWKFRDEVRPRFGVMRGREFLMKDAYSFDRRLRRCGAQLPQDDAGLHAHVSAHGAARRSPWSPIPARSAATSATNSSSWPPPAKARCSTMPPSRTIDTSDAAVSADSDADLERFFHTMTTHYAATEEKHDTEAWAKLDPAQRREGRGIEVGHIFYFGQKYSKAMGFSVAGPDGVPVVPEMGSYGIGVSRLVGAIIEASHDSAGIIWPDAVAPFRAAILDLRAGDAATGAICEKLYAGLQGQALLDDRDERAGAKFADADLMGLPWQIIVGPKGAAAGRVELKRRATGERQEVAIDDALNVIA
jgi:prolyl-tRNA synthetase